MRELSRGCSGSSPAESEIVGCRTLWGALGSLGRAHSFLAFYERGRESLGDENGMAARINTSHAIGCILRGLTQ